MRPERQLTWWLMRSDVTILLSCGGHCWFPVTHHKFTTLNYAGTGDADCVLWYMHTRWVKYYDVGGIVVIPAPVLVWLRWCVFCCDGHAACAAPFFWLYAVIILNAMPMTPGCGVAERTGERPFMPLLLLTVMILDPLPVCLHCYCRRLTIEANSGSVTFGDMRWFLIDCDCITWHDPDILLPRYRDICCWLLFCCVEVLPMPLPLPSTLPEFCAAGLRLRHWLPLLYLPVRAFAHCVLLLPRLLHHCTCSGMGGPFCYRYLDWLCHAWRAGDSYWRDTLLVANLPACAGHLMKLHILTARHIVAMTFCRQPSLCGFAYYQLKTFVIITFRALNILYTCLTLIHICMYIILIYLFWNYSSDHTCVYIDFVWLLLQIQFLFLFGYIVWLLYRLPVGLCYRSFGAFVVILWIVIGRCRCLFCSRFYNLLFFTVVILFCRITISIVPPNFVVLLLCYGAGRVVLRFFLSWYFVVFNYYPAWQQYASMPNNCLC